jgi:hypothetical protein
LKSFLGGRGERGLPVTYLLCQWGAGRGGGFKICPILGFAFKDQFPTVNGNRDLILLYVNLYCTSVSLRQYCTQIPSPHYPSFFISTPLQNYPSAYSLLIISIFSLSTHPRIQIPLRFTIPFLACTQQQTIGPRFQLSHPLWVT